MIQRSRVLFSAVMMTALCFFLISAVGCKKKQGPPSAKPFPQHVTYAGETIKPSNYSQDEIDDQVKANYDFWKERYLVAVKDANPPQKFVFYTKDAYAPEDYLVEDIKNSFAVTASEAHGYGMVLLAYMAGYDNDAKADFDAMFNYFQKHKSAIDSNLMAWQQYVVKPDIDKHLKVAEVDKESWYKYIFNESENFTEVLQEDSQSSDSATDGDMDIAYALLLADNQWGSAGAINYREEAMKVIHALMDSVVDQKTWTLKLGDWVRPDLSEDEQKFRSATRPSDFILGHIKVFASVDAKDSEKWMKVYNKINQICIENFKNVSPNTGLMPDFMIKEGDSWIPPKGEFLETENDGDNNYNACRAPWRLSAGYILFGDTALKEMLDTTNKWIRTVTKGKVRMVKEDGDFVNGGYYVINGTNGDRIADTNYDELCFASPFAVSATINKENQEWLNTLWDAIAVNDEKNKENPGYFNPKNIQSDYFGYSINMQALILISGNYWIPQ